MYFVKFSHVNMIKIIKMPPRFPGFQAREARGLWLIVFCIIKSSLWYENTMKRACKYRFNPTSD